MPSKCACGRPECRTQPTIVDTKGNKWTAGCLAVNKIGAKRDEVVHAAYLKKHKDNNHKRQQRARDGDEAAMASVAAASAWHSNNNGAGAAAAAAAGDQVAAAQLNLNRLLSAVVAARKKYNKAVVEQLLECYWSARPSHLTLRDARVVVACVPPLIQDMIDTVQHKHGSSAVDALLWGAQLSLSSQSRKEAGSLHSRKTTSHLLRGIKHEVRFARVVCVWDYCTAAAHGGVERTCRSQHPPSPLPPPRTHSSFVLCRCWSSRSCRAPARTRRPSRAPCRRCCTR